MPVGKKIIMASVAITFAVMVSVFLAAGIYVERYAGRVYPGVTVGSYPLGGLSSKDLVALTENFNNKLNAPGIVFDVSGETGDKSRVYFSTSVNDSALLAISANQLIEEAIGVGRKGNWLERLFKPLFIRFGGGAVLEAPLVGNDLKLMTALKETLGRFEDPPRDATLVWSASSSAFVVAAEKSGIVINYQEIRSAIARELGALRLAPIRVVVRSAPPLVISAEASSAIPEAERLTAGRNLKLEFFDHAINTTTARVLPLDLLQSWVAVRRAENGAVEVGLNTQLVEVFLAKEIGPLVNQSPESARFVMEGDKVTDFYPGHPGRRLDALASAVILDQVFRSLSSSTAPLVVALAPPPVSLASLNDLGISDIIGVGLSTFKDSHTNRIKNIAHAVARLNGTLIKPGEEFSANRAAGPFTAENGYLPEMVIKGKEIKPEVGGGMCQIGTTLFRMAMNSGMDITQRRNHSLVVSYYADPVNGNPGTDATLYEPILDLKFKNDTGNYLLLQTAIDFKKQQLAFTLWGKPDGRSGSYTHPVVHRWIPAGEPEEIVVDDGKLKPGERKCQNAFRGAVASFTYSRVTPSGEKIDRIFESYYRPLPKICMVGAEKKPVCPEGEVCPPPGGASPSVVGQTIDTVVPVN